MLNSFRDLIVWRKSYALCLLVYRHTREFPKSEEFGLVSQLRRSAVSVPSNIAEGYNRKSKKEYIQFLYTSSGSLGELQTQLMISHDIGYIDDVRFTEMYDISIEVDKMLNKLIESLSERK
ncbi:MAG TPA: four helix bundle protein [candidate division Zixibacteria bacterium]|nr:four helix bundle protein [candidate division Zixibacteria bacterium]